MPTGSPLGVPDELAVRTGQASVLKNQPAHATSYVWGETGDHGEQFKVGVRPRVHGGKCRLVIALEVGLEVAQDDPSRGHQPAVQEGTPPWRVPSRRAPLVAFGSYGPR